MIEAMMRAPLSLHATVRQELLRRIQEGAYEGGELLPSTAMLSDEFGVSPITIKRALRDLQAAGVLISVTGKGAYVKQHKRLLQRLDVSFIEGAQIQLLSITREKITDPSLAAFEPPRQALLCVRKKILVENAPFMYDATYLSADVDGEIIDEFGQSFIADALERHGVRALNTDIIVDAAPAAGAVEEVFGIPTGYPMLRRLYKITTTERALTLFGVVQAPFDQLACSISLPAPPVKRAKRKGGQ